MIASDSNSERAAARRGVAGMLSALPLVERPARAAGSAQEQVSRDFQQTVALGAGLSVRVEHKFGSVRLHGESGREVKISATIRAQASSYEEAESFAQKIKIEVQQTGEGVRIRLSIPRKRGNGFTPAKTLHGPSVMTLGCHPTRRSPCETVSEALI